MNPNNNLEQKLAHQIDGIRSKHVSVPLLCMAIACRRSIVLYCAPDISDLLWVCAAARIIGDSIEFDQLRLDYRPRSLSPNEEIDLSQMDCSLRQSLILAPLAMHISRLYLPLPSGDIIGLRPIQGYRDVLKRFHLELQVDENCLKVINQYQFERPLVTEVFLPVASTGVSFVALSCGLNANPSGTTRITNASVDPELYEALQACNIAHDFDKKDKSLQVHGPLPPNLEATIPLDRIAVSELLLAAIIHNRSHLISRLQSILGSRMGEAFFRIIDKLQAHQGMDGSIVITASQLPGISTDILPALCVSMWLRNVPFRVQDHIFEWRMPMLQSAMAAVSSDGLEAIQNGFSYEPHDPHQTKHAGSNRLWISDNIRQTSAGLLALVAPNSQVENVMDRNGSIFRAYTTHWFRALELISGVTLHISPTHEGDGYVWMRASEICSSTNNGGNNNNLELGLTQ